MAGSCTFLIMSRDYWMKSFMFHFLPGVRRIYLLLTVILENELKYLPNSVDVLSMHDSKPSSNTFVKIISDFVKHWNRSMSSTTHINNASLTVWLASFGACVIILYIPFVCVIAEVEFIVKSIG